MFLWAQLLEGPGCTVGLSVLGHLLSVLCVGATGKANVCALAAVKVESSPADLNVYAGADKSTIPIAAVASDKTLSESWMPKSRAIDCNPSP